jgi:CubicO group peptidase (beta-lactamase class C family)
VLAGDGSRRTVPATRPISFRHLLAHTAGFSYRMAGEEPLATLYAEAGVSDGLSEVDFSLADNVKRLARAPLRHQPGEAFTYGLSTDVLGYALERISDKALDELLRERIFEPLGMRDTSFVVPPSERDRLARVYHWSETGGLRALPDTPQGEGHLRFSPGACLASGPRYLSGGAGLVSTAADYLRFARMLAAGGRLGDVKLLEPETVREMTKNQIGSERLPGGATFGLGVALVGPPEDDRPSGSFGWQGFYHTSFWVDPEHSLVGVFLSQLRSESDASPADDFVSAAYR